MMGAGPIFYEKSNLHKHSYHLRKDNFHLIYEV